MSETKEKKEAKDREIIQLIQSRCAHRRRGVISEKGHNITVFMFYCQDCLKILYDEEL